MKKKYIIILLSIILLPFAVSHTTTSRILNSSASHKQLVLDSPDYFKGTKAWDLSKAIYSQDLSKIRKIIKNHPELINFRSPETDHTILYWTIFKDRFESAKLLLELGADPNLSAKGQPLLNHVAGFKPLKYTNLLISYNADLDSIDKHDATPLMCASNSLPKIKALVEAGADIDMKTTHSDSNALRYVLYFSPEIETIHYFIVEKQACTTFSHSKRDILYVLQSQVIQKNSTEYTLLLEILEKLEKNGLIEDASTIELNIK